MIDSVVVTAPARLHFGLLRFAQAPRQFGGMGVMIDAPSLTVEVRAAHTWLANGPCADESIDAGRKALAAFACPAAPLALAIDVHSAPPRHQGLGSGTQLALAIAASVAHLCGTSHCEAPQLSGAVGRGRRSAVGSHGFIHGGLIWEQGRTECEPLAPLVDRSPLPDEWRVVVCCSDGHSGLSGECEQRAFQTLPAVPSATTAALERLAQERILPAARGAHLGEFGEAVYEFGRRAGECFATIQGGPYASPRLAAQIEAIRGTGVTGTGQSSWGPAVYAFTASEDAAADLIARLAPLPAFSDARFIVAAPANTGARIDVVRRR
ncbi:MAG: hypothetical protein KDA61_13770 [Planctomycetales bacterium]|nr:hypothetical protein [Planctomycetales bacterium]